MRYIIAIPPTSEFAFEQSSISSAIFQVFQENNVGEPSLDGIMDWKWTVNLKNHPLDLSIGNGGKGLFLDGLEADIIAFISHLLNSFPSAPPFPVFFDQGYNFHLELSPSTRRSEIEEALGM
jgi:hypothetical protein